MFVYKIIYNGRQLVVRERECKWFWHVRAVLSEVYRADFNIVEPIADWLLCMLHVRLLMIATHCPWARVQVSLIPARATCARVTFLGWLSKPYITSGAYNRDMDKRLARKLVGSIAQISTYRWLIIICSSYIRLLMHIMFRTIRVVFFPYAYGLSHIRIPVWETRSYAYGDSHTRMGQPYAYGSASKFNLSCRIGKGTGTSYTCRHCIELHGSYKF